MKRWIGILLLSFIISSAFSADLSKIRFVFPTVDKGFYSLALNSNSVWSDTPGRLIIQARIPWYTTRLTILLFVVTIATIIVFYFRQREKQVVEDKINLEKKIQGIQAELKNKSRMVEQLEEEIRRKEEEEKDIRFFTNGVAKLSDIISKKRKNLEELSSTVIAELARYVEASAGGIFVMDDSDLQHIVLRATGDFCLSSEQSVNYSFEIGEGNIGSCFKEKKTLFADNLPEGYILMRSGLGSISLHHALFVPIIQDNECVGVIEIASLEKLPENKVLFIEKIAESLASIIIIIKANEKSGQMIEQNNVQAEELRIQEEEMRQNIEELMASQEESQRREKELRAELETKNKLIQELKANLK